MLCAPPPPPPPPPTLYTCDFLVKNDQPTKKKVYIFIIITNYWIQSIDQHVFFQLQVLYFFLELVINVLVDLSFTPQFLREKTTTKQTFFLGHFGNASYYIILDQWGLRPISSKNKHKIQISERKQAVKNIESNIWQ